MKRRFSRKLNKYEEDISLKTPGNHEVTRPFSFFGDGCNLLISIKVRGVTSASKIEAKLYSGSLVDPATDLPIFRTSPDAVVEITGDGVVDISLLEHRSADQSVLPLGDHGKIVVTTGAGDEVIVSEIRILECDK